MQTIYDRFQDTACANASKPFVVFPENLDASITFAQALQDTKRFAVLFAQQNVGTGDLVAIMLPTHRYAVGAFFGASRCGAIPTFFPPASSKQDAGIFWASHREVFRRIEVRLIVTDRTNAALIATYLPELADRCVGVETSLPPATEPNLPTPCEIAFLQHSSGTTGLKKGVVLTHKMVLAHIDGIAKCLDIKSDDSIVSWLPLYHDMGLISCFVLPALLGLTVIMHDPFTWAIRPAMLLDTVTKYRPSLCWQPNFAFHHLARMADPKAIYDLSSLRAIINCSEPCKPETFALFTSKFAAHGLRSHALQVCYAMAEAVFLVTQTALGVPPRIMLREGYSAALSCGKPMQGVEISIRDRRGITCASDEVGEVCIKSQTLFSGYYRMEPKRKIFQNGWYRSGDLGFLDADGELFIIGRTDDLIIVNGKNLYAHDIEFTINQLCSVKPGRAVAMAPFNPDAGSCALVVMAEAGENADPNSLVRKIKTTVHSAYGVSLYEALIVPEGSMAKTTSGKINREENLRKYLTERPNLRKVAS